MVGNHLWNAARVRNFVKELNGKPTKWEENIDFLAKKVNITVDNFLQMDPVTYGVKLWGLSTRFYDPNSKIKKIMGYLNYREMWLIYMRTEERKKKHKERMAALYDDYAFELHEPSDYSHKPEDLYEIHHDTSTEVSTVYEEPIRTETQYLAFTDNPEEVIEKFEECFMNITINSKLSLIDLAKLKVTSAEILIKFQENGPIIQGLLRASSPDMYDELMGKASRNFQAWKEKAEKDLADLEKQLSVLGTETFCPTCSAVWRTSS